MANYLSIDKRKQIFHLLCEGNGLRAITRLVKCSTCAVSELQKRYCHIIEFLNRKYITGLCIDEIEADELRTFIAKKDNIRWIYVAMDRNSRMVIHFHIGKRDTEDAKIFLVGLSHKLSSVSQVATDCLKSYVSAVERTPYGRIEAAVSSIGLLRSARAGERLGRAITNRIETHNGTIRQHISRLARRTRCFSKKEEGLRQHLTLFFFYYNFIKRHKSLKATPALVAGITDEAFWINKILEYDMLFTETANNTNSKKTYGLVENVPNEVKSIGQSDIDEFRKELIGLDGIKTKAKVIKLAG